MSTCTFQQFDIIYDSYIERSLNECERQRRASTDMIEYLDIDLSTPIPVQMDKFWGSSRNKEKIQQLSREFFQDIAIHEKVDVILSGYVSSGNEVHSCCKVTAGGIIDNEASLLSEIEEADSRIIPHISNAAKGEHRRVVVISNDTDVIALLLFYAETFRQTGM